MTFDKPLTLLINGTPPQEIIPELIEKWLILRKDNRYYRYAEVFQIESAVVEDSDVVFWTYETIFKDKKNVLQRRLASPETIQIFVDNKEATQSMIISASTKTGIIKYILEDAKGDPLQAPVTGKLIEETLHSDNIRIYCCLPVSIANNYRYSKGKDWHSTTPLKTIL